MSRAATDTPKASPSSYLAALFARAAAGLVRVQYTRDKGNFDLASSLDGAIKPPAFFGTEPDSSFGDFDAAFASAPVKLDEHYTTPDHSHAMMEPHASIASWD